MSLAEFHLIDYYFNAFNRPPCAQSQTGIVLGIGDDAAIVEVPAGHHLVLTIDTLVAGVHFPPDTPPEAIAHKALAVNLSDLAAMAAQPLWFTLALTLPHADANWLQAFSQGLRRLAHQYQVALIGGDTTRGPLSITIQAHGCIPAGQVITRRQAQAGDDIYVTGTIGDAGLALAALQGRVALSAQDMNTLLPRLHTPQPRILEGLALRHLAHSLIDISDGLAADLSHILQQSQVGAHITLDQLPLSAPVKRWLQQGGDVSLPLTAGDDYELCFTASPNAREAIAALPFRITRIGHTTPHAGELLCRWANGQTLTLPQMGYQHF